MPTSVETRITTEPVIQLELVWSEWRLAREYHAPWGCEAEWTLTMNTNVISGRTAHLCSMTDEDRHEVVFLSAATPRRIYFIEEICKWRIKCHPRLAGDLEEKDAK